MSRARPPLFLERESYRRRRLMDGARILPVAGLVLILLPALWRSGGDPNTAAEALYVFAVWALLILIAAILARPLRRTGAPLPPEPGQPEPDQTEADRTEPEQRVRPADGLPPAEGSSATPSRPAPPGTAP